MSEEAGKSWTTGPWRLWRHTGDGITVGRHDDWTITGSDDQSICWEGGPNDNADANVKLIAASPDLYEALEVLLQEAERLDWSDHHNRGIGDYVEADCFAPARKALARARGQLA